MFGGGRRPGFGFGHFGGHRGHRNGKLAFAYLNVKASNGILITFVSEEFEKKSFW